LDYINQIICGDCLEVMKTLPDNSVDAVVTDPPYNLKFMNKAWDFKHNFQAWCQDWSTEALRVLKPGGYLLAFGGTRTYHRLVCGIEDAGFEIRDTIMWLYGSGFPKSLDISKAIDKRNGKTQEEFIKFAEYFKRKRKESHLRRKEIINAIMVNYKNFDSADAQISNFELTKNIPTKKDWAIFKKILNIDNKYDYLIDRVEAEREIIGINKVYEYKMGIQKEEHLFSGIGSKEKGKYITAPTTPEAKQWAGWGTALKPACEPIVVARKPLSESTVAENVLKWGTGGIDVDGGRISYENNDDFKDGHHNKQLSDNVKYKKTCFGSTYGYGLLNSNINKGRFPANVILDEQAAAMLDEMSGNCKSGWRDTDKHKGGNGIVNNFGASGITGQHFNDTGGASRFFYCAKASKRERNMGCEGLEERDAYNLGHKENPGRKVPKKSLPRANYHPTVKPLALMEYLIKLVSVKGAIILDPFCGSGTTAMGCINTGRKYIVIDNEKEYIEIAKCRVRATPELLFV